jgi:hypothetical protein
LASGAGHVKTLAQVVDRAAAMQKRMLEDGQDLLTKCCKVRTAMLHRPSLETQHGLKIFGGSERTKICCGSSLRRSRATAVP